jgi:hypothetical protein
VSRPPTSVTAIRPSVNPATAVGRTNPPTTDQVLVARSSRCSRSLRVSATHTVPSAATARPSGSVKRPGVLPAELPPVDRDLRFVAVLRDPLDAVAAVLDDPHIAVARVDRRVVRVEELARGRAARRRAERRVDARPRVDASVRSQHLHTARACVDDDDVAVGLDRDVARLHEPARAASVLAPAADERPVRAELGDVVERRVGRVRRLERASGSDEGRERHVRGELVDAVVAGRQRRTRRGRAPDRRRRPVRN